MALSGWGRYPRIRAQANWFETEAELSQDLEAAGKAREGLIAHGQGRSYGDSSLSREVVLTRRFRSVLDFDPQTGRLSCEAGLTLAELIEAFLPQGWFPATTTGTKLITVGGAIASDVHGKNHPQTGAFSEGVEWLELMTGPGEVVRCSREENPELFRATCGGMGLSGIILRAGLRLKPISSAYIRERVVVARNLEETFRRFEENRSAPFSVAWIDCLARGGMAGRSVLNLGWPLEGAGLDPLPERKLPLPFELPDFVMSKPAIALFNRLNFELAKVSSRERVRHLESFFYPLDSILNWNLMYGRSGFTQYQLVLPKEASFRGLRRVLERIGRSGLGAFLGVLKLLGPANENLLSFPLEGYTLALDFKIQPGLFRLLDELDRIVLDHGGRIYLTKDVRMKPETLRQGYPGWERFVELRHRLGLKPRFGSLQSRRLEV